jgi:hypothetical protein
MAAPITTQGLALETQFVEVANALYAAVVATPAATRGTYSASKTLNPAAKTITFTFTLDANDLVDDQVVGLTPKVILL